MDCWERFNDTEFPSHDRFYSTLSDSNISETDYKRSLLVWDEFNIRIFGAYHDLYLSLGVLLLYDVRLKFRKHCYFILVQTQHNSTPPQIIVGMLCQRIQESCWN